MDGSRIESILIDYIKRNLSPTYSERRTISEKYEELQKILRGRTFQNGSYARKTSTTPVNDLDVFYVLQMPVQEGIVGAQIDSAELDIRNVLESLAAALRREYPPTVAVRQQPHSVGIFFGEDDEFSIDVVPAVAAPNNLYLVPEISHLSVTNRRKFYKSSPKVSWILSAPKAYQEQASRLDDLTDGKFRKAAKLVKKWRLGCKNASGSFALKSFHVELLVTEQFFGHERTSIFGAVREFFVTLIDNTLSPRIADLADSTRCIDEYLNDWTHSDRELIANVRTDAVACLDAIEDARTESDVIKAVERLLGLTNAGPFLAVRRSTSAQPAVSRPWLK